MLGGHDTPPIVLASEDGDGIPWICLPELPLPASSGFDGETPFQRIK